uniref:Integrase, catalytic region, zinc finger, CCHC-type, peptidase aspartic, catalytic n=1 Tax=Tanacetum cinerariifolium TaxID=118510 RepID=A0A6L2NAJ1_TANCI|nr:hypothetical protein [Tanacetum cinerariifolium]
MISGRSLFLCVQVIMTSRPRTRIPSRPRLGCLETASPSFATASEHTRDDIRETQDDVRSPGNQANIQEGGVDIGKALDVSLVVTESVGQKQKQGTSSRSGNNTDALDANIRLVFDEEPRAEVHLTAENNVLANGQQHTEQSEPIYDTYLLEKMASEQFSSGPRRQLLTPGTISLGLVQNPTSLTPNVPPTMMDWDTLFQPMFDEYFTPPPSVASLVLVVVAPEPVDLTDTHSSTTIDQDAPSLSTSQTPHESQSLIIPYGVEEHFHDIEVAHIKNDPFFGVLISEPNFKETSSRDVIPTNVHSVNQPPEHLRK